MAEQNITPTWKQAYVSAAGLPYQLMAAIQGIAYIATAYAVNRSLLPKMAKVYLACLVLGCLAHADQVNCIKWKDIAGNQVGTYCKPFSVRAGTGIQFSDDGLGRITITGTGSIPAAGGADTQVNYNSSGQLAGSSSLTWNNSTSTLTASSLLAASLNNIRFADQFAGADCGAKINAADADLGSSSGEIWVGTGCTPTTFSAIVVVSSNHILRFRAGVGTFTNALTSGGLGHIRLKNNSSLLCDDWNTIIQESTYNGSRATIVQAFTTGPNSQANDITISGCHFQGANPIANSAPGSIEFANCLRCKFTNNWLDSTRDNGVIIGGSTGSTAADDAWVTDNLFTNVVAQTVAVVNGKNVHISRNIFRKPGLVMGGVDKIGTQVDVETNSPSDIAENIEIMDNVFDFRDSPVAEATGAWGVYFQHTPSATNSGPAIISGNTFIGGRIAEDGTATHHMVTAIACNGQPVGIGRDCVITNNVIINPLQAPITVSDANRALVMGNKILCNSDGVNGAILLKDATNSEVMDNVMEGDGTCTQGTNKQKVVEQGTSDNNLFVDNIGSGVVILGANTFHRSLDHSGNVTSNMPYSIASLTLVTEAAPTCDAAHRGRFSYTAGAGGVKDIVQVCGKDAADVYAYRAIY